MKNKITIATRKSALALWQAEYVASRLRKQYPALTVELLPVSTKGDEILQMPLAEIGGKGLFIKELEYLLLEGKADLAVHSLKDVPAELPEPFMLAAVTEREDPRDAFVSLTYDTVEALPAGAVVGTSSLRRQSQLLHRRPDLSVRSLRGNVQTRLKKLDEGQYDAVILAAAGLVRLGLAGRIRSYLSTDESIPAAGQGVMAVEIRKSDQELASLLSFLHDEKAAASIRAERAFLGEVGGDCKVPAGAFAEAGAAGNLTVHAFISSTDGRRFYRTALRGRAEDAASLGKSAAETLLAEGGREVLEELIGK